MTTLPQISPCTHPPSPVYSPLYSIAMNGDATTESWVLFAERVKGQVAELHQLLLAALTELSPRCEGPVFCSLQQLLACDTTREHVLRWHLQDVVASLVFLCPQDWATCEVSIVDQKEFATLWEVVPNTTSDLASLPYVSARDRMRCLRCFLSLVLLPTLSSRVLFEAVYPLLLDEQAAAEVPVTARSNMLAPALFRRLPTMRAKRPLIVGALDTLIMRRRDGIASMVDALLAEGVSGRGGALSAPHRCAELVLRSAPPQVFTVTGARAAFQRLSAEDEVRSVAGQLLVLMSGEEHRISDEQPPQGQARGFDVDVTRSDRIRETVYVILSRLLTAREANSACAGGGAQEIDTSSLNYRRFYYANKHLLTPALAPMTGRTRCTADRVLFALRCLRSVVHAASLTSWFDGCVTFLWERVVDGGFLPIMVSFLAELNDGLDGRTCEAEQWAATQENGRDIVSMPSRVEPLMYALARAVFTSSTNKTVCAQRTPRAGVSFVERMEGLAVPSARVAMITVLKWFGRTIVSDRCSIAKRALRRFFHYSCVVAQQTVVGNVVMSGGSTCASHAEAITAIADAFVLPDTATLLLCGEEVASLASTCACLATLSPQLAEHAVRIVQMAAVSTDWSARSASDCDEFVRAATRMVAFLRSEEHVLPTLLQAAGDGRDRATPEVPTKRSRSSTSDTLEVLDATLQKLAAARVPPRETDAESWSPLRRTLEASVSELLARWSSRSSAATAIAMMKLGSTVVSASALPAAEMKTLGPAVTKMESVLVQCFATSDDSALLAHAVTVYGRAVVLGLISEKQLLERIHEAASSGCRGRAATTSKPRKGAGPSVLLGRLFDVLLAICDDDPSGVRCRTVDDECKRQQSASLPEYIASVCRHLAACGDGVTYAAGLHMIGMFSSRLIDRVPMSWLCQFGADAVRLGSTQEMKLAGAAMLSTLALAIRQSVDPTNLSRLGASVDLAPLLELGHHMARYVALPLASTTNVFSVRTSHLTDRFDEVIRLHGRIVVDQLQAMSRECLHLGESGEVLSAWNRAQWNLWRKGSAEESALLILVRQVSFK